MKINELKIIETIEEIQSFLESNVEINLPVVVEDIIADFYMNDITKVYNLNWSNRISRQRDFKAVCYLERYLMLHGFIWLPTEDIQAMRLIKSLMCHKYPNADFNFEVFDPDFWRKTIDSFIHKLLQSKNITAKRKKFDYEYIEKIKNDLIIVGGIFTNYSLKSSYATVYKSAREIFQNKRDVDIYSNNSDLFEFESPRVDNQKEIFKYKNKTYKINLDLNDVTNDGVKLPCLINFINFSIDQTPAQMIKSFDFDFCKIYYDYNRNKLFIHSSLIFANLKNNFPKSKEIPFPEHVDWDSWVPYNHFERCLKNSLKGFERFSLTRKKIK